MSTGLCVLIQNCGEVPWEHLQSFLVSKSIASSRVLRNLSTTDRMFDSDVGTIMKERLPMVDIDMENEVATLHVTLGLALQKLLLVGLHFPSSEIDRLFDKLNNILKNAGDDVKARALQPGVDGWHTVGEESKRPALRNSWGWEEQEKRFPHAGGWWHWTIFSQRPGGAIVTETMITLVAYLLHVFLSVGLQTSIENEPKSSCNSWEDFGIRLSLGAGM